MAEVITRRPPFSEYKVMNLSDVIEVLAGTKDQLVDLESINSQFRKSAGTGQTECKSENLLLLSNSSQGRQQTGKNS